MKKLAFAFVTASAAMLAACNSGNQDQVNNAELNQPSPELNALADDAANNAAADPIVNQPVENTANTTADNTTNPEDADEQNVAGM